MLAVPQTTDNRMECQPIAEMQLKRCTWKKNIKDIKDERKNSVDIERRDQFYSGKCK